MNNNNNNKKGKRNRQSTTPSVMETATNSGSYNKASSGTDGFSSATAVKRARTNSISTLIAGEMYSEITLKVITTEQKRNHWGDLYIVMATDGKDFIQVEANGKNVQKLKAIIGQEHAYIIRCEPKVKDKNWQCPVKLHFAVYQNIQNQCYYKRTLHVTFCSEGTALYFTHPKLTTNNLSEHFPTGSFWSSIEIFVSPPSGLINCLPLNANLQLGVFGLAVNKELLAAHSDHFRKLFETTPIGDYNTFEVDIDQSPGGVAHFKVLYDILESDDTSQLNGQNVEGVLYLANKFQFHKAETACFTFVNDKKNKLTLVEKLILYNLIGAEAAKRDAIKRASRKEVANPTKFVRALYAAKKLSFEDIIEMEQIASETFPNM